jgi:outer membrane protein OmpA-like peptidoglycan-associated protein
MAQRRPGSSFVPSGGDLVYSAKIVKRGVAVSAVARSRVVRGDRGCRFRHLIAITSAAACSLGIAAGDASAQPSGFALNRFEPAERGSSWFVLDSLDIRGHTRPAAGATLDYQYRPLAIYDADGQVRSEVVRQVLSAHVGGSIVAYDRLRFGASLPLVPYTEGERGSLFGLTYAPPDREQAVGDLRLAADVKLFGDPNGKLTAALGGRVWLPTGSTAAYTGDGSVRTGPRVAVAGAAGALVFAATAGLAFRTGGGTFAGSPVDHELVYGASAGARLVKGNVTVGPELYGATVLDAAFETRSTPLEALLGARVALGHGLGAGAGVGTGLVAGYGSPGARFIGSFEWAPHAGADEDGDGIPDAEDACPSEKGTRSADPDRNGCPLGSDTDGDGIPDKDDACMDVYGQRTSDPRTNGCDDRDGDGIMDPLDACPFERGVPSKDPKGNGCPADGDGDGIPDVVDACPDVPGVKSDELERDGCPDLDPDRDGIPNEADACPNRPGKPDPDPKRNGCPMAFIQGDEIRLHEQVRFRGSTAELAPGKDNEAILQAIVDLLKEHPEIAEVRVEGHTDNRGDPAANKNLSVQRAAAVARWLVAHGIAKGRVRSVGVGGDKPLDSNDTEEGRAMNRRVEIHIERKEEGTP